MSRAEQLKDLVRDKGALSVTGEGRVQRAPDVATITLSSRSEAKSAAEASAKNAETLEAIVGAMGALGLGEEALRTSGLSLLPTYRYDETSGQQVLTGYRAESSVVVSCAPELAGEVFDAGVAAGANLSSGLSFGLSDSTLARREALTLAVQRATGEAEAVARALGIALRGPEQVEIEPGAVASPVLRTTTSSESSTPVLPGRVEVVARVHVTWDTVS
ncbi:MAG: SIMPL domain-containing protein [Alphaproteobacteria bacterium]|nr:SIMPL domain-containing protein [Alphaproteobacteria bacterium]